MISLETAKALKDAGLKWEPEYGDWYHVERLGVNPQIVAIRDLNHTLIFNGADLCTWLPRLDQLLAEIEKRGYAYVVHSKDFHITEDYFHFECYLIDDTSMHKSFRATTIEDVAAQALLWILKEGQE